jgi:glycosyltransferase involved in cell wall biosynthesis
VKQYLLVTGDFVTTGGMDRANHALASYLARRGDDVHLVSHRVADDLIAMPNVTVHHVPKLAKSYLLGGPLLDRAGRYWAKRLSAAGARVVVNGGNCHWGDVNWVHYVHAAYTPQSATGFARRIKNRWHHRMSLADERNAIGSAKLVIANSQRTKQDLVESVGIAEDRIRVIYYGTAPNEFRPATAQERSAVRAEMGWPQDRPIAMFIGALADRRKGFDVLFESWATLCKETGWDADLAVIGSGAELNRWRSRATEMGMASRIHFLGFRSDVPRLLSACDVLIAPTRYEAYGLGIQEAWCCGLPAILSAQAGASERCPVALRDLLIQDPQSQAELVARIRSWRANSDTYRNAAIEAVPVFQRHTWDAMAEKIVNLLDSLPRPDKVAG